MAAANSGSSVSRRNGIRFGRAVALIAAGIVGIPAA